MFIDITIILLAYLLGSISFGLIIAKIAGTGDLRSEGSGNIGATNMVRVGGKKLGALTLILDGLKGVIAVLLARYFEVSNEVEMLVAATVVLGHIFPVWLKFKGGKGVATTFFVITTVCPPLGIASLAIWLITFFALKLSSLSAIVSMFIMPFIAFRFVMYTGQNILCLSVFLSILVIFRHKDNIKRLIKGEEK